MLIPQLAWTFVLGALAVYCVTEESIYNGFTYYADSSLSGKDVKYTWPTAGVSSWQACAHLCQTTANCGGFTYKGSPLAECQLKESPVEVLLGSTSTAGAITGLRREAHLHDIESSTAALHEGGDVEAVVGAKAARQDPTGGAWEPGDSQHERKDRFLLNLLQPPPPPSLLLDLLSPYLGGGTPSPPPKPPSQPAGSPSPMSAPPPHPLSGSPPHLLSGSPPGPSPMRPPAPMPVARPPPSGSPPASGTAPPHFSPPAPSPKGPSPSPGPVASQLTPPPSPSPSLGMPSPGVPPLSAESNYPPSDPDTSQPTPPPSSSPATASPSLSTPPAPIASQPIPPNSSSPSLASPVPSPPSELNYPPSDPAASQPTPPPNSTLSSLPPPISRRPPSPDDFPPSEPDPPTADPPLPPSAIDGYPPPGLEPPESPSYEQFPPIAPPLPPSSRQPPNSTHQPSPSPTSARPPSPSPLPPPSPSLTQPPSPSPPQPPSPIPSLDQPPNPSPPLSANPNPPQPPTSPSPPSPSPSPPQPPSPPSPLSASPNPPQPPTSPSPPSPSPGPPPLPSPPSPLSASPNPPQPPTSPSPPSPSPGPPPLPSPPSPLSASPNPPQPPTSPSPPSPSPGPPPLPSPPSPLSASPNPPQPPTSPSPPSPSPSPPQPPSLPSPLSASPNPPQPPTSPSPPSPSPGPPPLPSPPSPLSSSPNPPQPPTSPSPPSPSPGPPPLPSPPSPLSASPNPPQPPTSPSPPSHSPSPPQPPSLPSPLSASPNPPQPPTSPSPPSPSPGPPPLPSPPSPLSASPNPPQPPTSPSPPSPSPNPPQPPTSPSPPSPSPSPPQPPSLPSPLSASPNPPQPPTSPSPLSASPNPPQPPTSPSPLSASPNPPQPPTSPSPPSPSPSPPQPPSLPSPLSASPNPPQPPTSPSPPSPSPGPPPLPSPPSPLSASPNPPQPPTSPSPPSSSPNPPQPPTSPSPPSPSPSPPQPPSLPSPLSASPNPPQPPTSPSPLSASPNPPQPPTSPSPPSPSPSPPQPPSLPSPLSASPNPPQPPTSPSPPSSSPNPPQPPTSPSPPSPSPSPPQPPSLPSPLSASPNPPQPPTSPSPPSPSPSPPQPPSLPSPLSASPNPPQPPTSPSPPSPSPGPPPLPSPPSPLSSSPNPPQLPTSPSPPSPSPGPPPLPSPSSPLSTGPNPPQPPTSPSPPSPSPSPPQPPSLPSPLSASPNPPQPPTSPSPPSSSPNPPQPPTSPSPPSPSPSPPQPPSLPSPLSSSPNPPQPPTSPLPPSPSPGPPPLPSPPSPLSASPNPPQPPTSPSPPSPSPSPPQPPSLPSPLSASPNPPQPPTSPSPPSPSPGPPPLPSPPSPLSASPNPPQPPTSPSPPSPSPSPPQPPSVPSPLSASPNPPQPPTSPSPPSPSPGPPPLPSPPSPLSASPNPPQPPTSPSPLSASPNPPQPPTSPSPPSPSPSPPQPPSLPSPLSASPNPPQPPTSPSPPSPSPGPPPLTSPPSPLPASPNPPQPPTSPSPPSSSPNPPQPPTSPSPPSPSPSPPQPPSLPSPLSASPNPPQPPTSPSPPSPSPSPPQPPSLPSPLSASPNPPQPPTSPSPPSPSPGPPPLPSPPSPLSSSPNPPQLPTSPSPPSPSPGPPPLPSPSSPLSTGPNPPQPPTSPSPPSPSPSPPQPPSLPSPLSASPNPPQPPTSPSPPSSSPNPPQPPTSPSPPSPSPSPPQPPSLPSPLSSSPNPPQPPTSPSPPSPSPGPPPLPSPPSPLSASPNPPQPPTSPSPPSPSPSPPQPPSLPSPLSASPNPPQPPTSPSPPSPSPGPPPLPSPPSPLSASPNPPQPPTSPSPPSPSPSPPQPPSVPSPLSASPNPPQPPTSPSPPSPSPGPPPLPSPPSPLSASPNPPQPPSSPSPPSPSPRPALPPSPRPPSPDPPPVPEPPMDPVSMQPPFPPSPDVTPATGLCPLPTGAAFYPEPTDVPEAAFSVLQNAVGTRFGASVRAECAADSDCTAVKVTSTGVVELMAGDLGAFQKLSLLPGDGDDTCHGIYVTSPPGPTQFLCMPQLRVPGTTLSSKSGFGLRQCELQCRKTAGCEAVLYYPSSSSASATMNCDLLRGLFGSDAASSYAVSSVNITTCIATSDPWFCLPDGWDIVGSNVGEPATQSSAEACAAACLGTPYCSSYTYTVSTGVCNSRTLTWRPSGTDGATGVAAETTQRSCVKTAANSFGSGTDATFFWSHVCFAGVTLGGSVVATQEDVAVADCADLCAEHDDCTHFQLNGNGDCEAMNGAFGADGAGKLSYGLNDNIATTCLRSTGTFECLAPGYSFKYKSISSAQGVSTIDTCAESCLEDSTCEGLEFDYSTGSCILANSIFFGNRGSNGVNTASSAAHTRLCLRTPNLRKLFGSVPSGPSPPPAPQPPASSPPKPMPPQTLTPSPPAPSPLPPSPKPPAPVPPSPKPPLPAPPLSPPPMPSPPLSPPPMPSPPVPSPPTPSPPAPSPPVPSPPAPSPPVPSPPAPSPPVPSPPAPSPPTPSPPAPSPPAPSPPVPSPPAPSPPVPSPPKPSPPSPSPPAPSPPSPPPPMPSPPLLPPPPSPTPPTPPPPSPPPPSPLPPSPPPPSPAPPSPKPPLPPPSPAPSPPPNILNFNSPSPSSPPPVMLMPELALEAGRPPPPAATPDIDPPEITLTGSSEVALEIYSTYVEYGASAVDQREGRVAVRIVGDEVNTSAVTPVGKPYTVIYQASDSAGNTARQERLVTVYDSCSSTGEFRCPDTLKCSVFKSCKLSVSSSSSSTASVTQTALERPPDTIPPVITVLGSGVRYVTPSGSAGMITTVQVGATFTDAGATATDEVPSAGGASTFVSMSVFSSIMDPSGEEVTAVSTANPTGNDTSSSVPYLITYSAIDSSGNAALVARRRVYILCTDPEFACPREGDTDPLTCSTGRICGLVSSSSSSTAPSSSATSSSSSSTTTTTTSGNSDSLLVPRFTLNSAATVAVAQGASYPVCRDGVTSTCEPGATATLKTSGDLNSQIRACATGVRNAQPFDMVGLQYCTIDTRVPGNYSISFHLTWPSVGELILYRYIIVQELCVGERTCSNGRCSVDQACEDELQSGTSSSGTSASSSGSSGSSISTATVTNSAPTLVLNTSSDIVGLQVSVKRGVAYQRCTSGQAPTADKPCETLGTATDAEDGDLTSKIALCPPDNCAKTQCRAHWADRKQPSECGIDTVNAAIGTTYSLKLGVYDSMGVNATVERIIKVVSPCSTGQSYCEETSASGETQYVCSDVSCEQRASLTALADVGTVSTTTPPRLFLLPGAHADNLTLSEANQTTFLAYRQPASFSLAPCASFSDGVPSSGIAACAAIANDTTDGDITSSISTTVSALCTSTSTTTTTSDTTNESTSSSSSSSCYSCSVAGFTTGSCLPGRYRISYSVTSSSGLTTTDTLDVAVEQLTTTVAELSLFPNQTAAGSSNFTFAQAFAVSLASNATVRNSVLPPALQVFGITAASIRSLSLLGAPEVLSSANSSTGGSSTAYYVVKVSVNVTTGSSDFMDTSSVTSAAATRRRYRARRSLLASSTAEPGLSGSTEGRILELLPVGDEQDSFVYVAASSPGVVSQQFAVDEQDLDEGYDDSTEASAAYEDLSQNHASHQGSAKGIGNHQPQALGARAMLLHSIAQGLLGLPFGTLKNTTDGAGRRVALETWKNAGDPRISPFAPTIAGEGSVLAALYDIRDRVDLALRLLSTVQVNDVYVDHQQPTAAGSTAAAATHTIIRRVLQTTSSSSNSSSSCGSAVAANTSVAAFTSGVASVGNVSNSCASPAADSTSVAMGVIAGAVSDLDRLAKQMSEQETSMISLLSGLNDKFSAKDEVYRAAIAAMSDNAVAVFNAISSKSQEALDLLDKTLAAQVASAAALATTLGLMQSTLNEAQAATTRAVITAATILEGLGDEYAFYSTESDYASYSNCLFARGQEAGFAFVTSWAAAAAGDSSFYTASAAALSAAASRRRQLLLHMQGKAPVSSKDDHGEALRSGKTVNAVFSGGMEGCGWSSSVLKLMPQVLRRALVSAMKPWLSPGAFGEAASRWLACGGSSQDDDVHASPSSTVAGVEERTGDETHQQSSEHGMSPHKRIRRYSPAGPEPLHTERATSDTSNAHADNGSDDRDHEPGVASSRMLISDSGSKNRTFNGRNQYVFTQFEGYDLPSGQGFDYSLWEVRNVDRARFAGLHNKVLVGLLLHQVRRSGRELRGTSGVDGRICRSSSYDHLVVGCDSDTSNDNRTPNSGDLGGIGNDPVFNRHSELYASSAIAGDFYNTSTGSPELNAAGLPYGFYHEPLEQFPAGYPVLLDTRLSAQRAQQAITFVRDGGYLSSTFTKSLRAQLVTYNPNAQVFGYWRVDFSWLDSGVIDAKARLLGLPAISYGDSIVNMKISRFLPDFFLVLLVIGYFAMTAYDIYKQLRVQKLKHALAQRRKAWGAAAAFANAAGFNLGGRNRVLPGEVANQEDEAHGSDSSSDDDDDNAPHAKSKAPVRSFRTGVRYRTNVHEGNLRKYHPRMDIKWVLYEATICAFMAAAIGVFYTYAVRLSVRDDFTSRFDVYDADTFAPARYFLLRRQDSSTTAAAASSPSFSATASSTATTTASEDAPSAGQALRWALPADYQPINDAGAMYARVDSMYSALVTYTFLQSLVLAMVVLRWLHYLSFQPRLSIIAGTLALALPDLLHFAAGVLICIAMFGAAACVVFGTGVAQLSSGGDALYLMLKYVLLKDDGRVFKHLLGNSVSKSGLEWALAGLLYVLAPLFFVYVLSNFILAFLVWPFGQLKVAVTGQPGVPEDLSRILGWYWQRFSRNAPKNKLMLTWLQAWLAPPNQRSVLYRLQHSVANFRATISAFSNIAPGRRNLFGSVAASSTSSAKAPFSASAASNTTSTSLGPSLSSSAPITAQPPGATSGLSAVPRPLANNGWSRLKPRVSVKEDTAAASITPEATTVTKATGSTGSLAYTTSQPWGSRPGSRQGSSQQPSRHRSILKMANSRRPLDCDAIQVALQTVSRARLMSAAPTSASATPQRASQQSISASGDAPPPLDCKVTPRGGLLPLPPMPPPPLSGSGTLKGGSIGDAAGGGLGKTLGKQPSWRSSGSDVKGRNMSGTTATSLGGLSSGSGGLGTNLGFPVDSAAGKDEGYGSGTVRGSGSDKLLMPENRRVNPEALISPIGSKMSLLRSGLSRTVLASVGRPAHRVAPGDAAETGAAPEVLVDTVMANLLARFGHKAASTGTAVASTGGLEGLGEASAKKSKPGDRGGKLPRRRFTNPEGTALSGLREGDVSAAAAVAASTSDAEGAQAQRGSEPGAFAAGSTEGAAAPRSRLLPITAPHTFTLGAGKLPAPADSWAVRRPGSGSGSRPGSQGLPDYPSAKSRSEAGGSAGQSGGLGGVEDSSRSDGHASDFHLPNVLHDISETGIMEGEDVEISAAYNIAELVCPSPGLSPSSASRGASANGFVLCSSPGAMLAARAITRSRLASPFTVPGGGNERSGLQVLSRKGTLSVSSTPSGRSSRVGRQLSASLLSAPLQLPAKHGSMQAMPPSRWSPTQNQTEDPATRQAAGKGRPDKLNSAPASDVPMTLGFRAPARASTDCIPVASPVESGPQPERSSLDLESLQTHTAGASPKKSQTAPVGVLICGEDGDSEDGATAEDYVVPAPRKTKAWPTMRFQPAEAAVGSPIRRHQLQPFGADVALQDAIGEEGEQGDKEDKEASRMEVSPTSRATPRASAALDPADRQSRTGGTTISGPGPVAEGMEDPAAAAVVATYGEDSGGQRSQLLAALGPHAAPAKLTRKRLDGALAVHMVATIEALTVHLNAMLAQLLMAVREIEDMSGLISSLLAAARATQHLHDRSATAAALREAVSRYLRGAKLTPPLARPPELELPLPVLQLPAGLVKLQQQRRQKGLLRAPAATAAAVAAAPRLPALTTAAKTAAVGKKSLIQRTRNGAGAAASGGLAGTKQQDNAGDTGVLLALAAAAVASRGGSLSLSRAEGAAGSAGEATAAAGDAATGRARSPSITTKQRRGWAPRRKALVAAEARQQTAEQGQLGEDDDGMATTALPGDLNSFTVVGNTAGKKSFSRLAPRPTTADAFTALQPNRISCAMVLNVDDATAVETYVGGADSVPASTRPSAVAPPAAAEAAAASRAVAGAPSGRCVVVDTLLDGGKDSSSTAAITGGTNAVPDFGSSPTASSPSVRKWPNLEAAWDDEEKQGNGAAGDAGKEL
ncbi:hypothetical protein Agub_g13042 [Astrephomene gubernaculifera]|uniref:Apple domain-containing protein n=1 Tax=Astrephomene gubernaculifera TaxID=47775 RepID=A0AAD3E0R8_9CHLO|nr:hypothetical protein Agub_g13042 [Astrephomene gubernaculifera]